MLLKLFFFLNMEQHLHATVMDAHIHTFHEYTIRKTSTLVPIKDLLLSFVFTLKKISIILSVCGQNGR